ncbi:hypothetical protein GCM10029992_36450 [Glycomyces albus]
MGHQWFCARYLRQGKWALEAQGWCGGVASAVAGSLVVVLSEGSGDEDFGVAVLCGEVKFAVLPPHGSRIVRRGVGSRQGAPVDGDGRVEIEQRPADALHRRGLHPLGNGDVRVEGNFCLSDTGPLRIPAASATHDVPPSMTGT